MLPLSFRWFSSISGEVKKHRFWLHLVWNDILKQYRRPFLGSVWNTLNTAIFAIVFSLVGARRLQTSQRLRVGAVVEGDD